MSHPIRFKDHTAFHAQVWQLSLAGAGLFLIAYGAGLVFPLDTRAAAIITQAAIAAVIGLVALPPTRGTWVGTVALALALGLLGAFGRELLAQAAYPWFGVGITGAVIGVIAGRDLRDVRRWLLPLASGVAVVLATYVTGVFSSELRFAEYVPPLVAEPAYGAIFGFLVSMGLVVRQIVSERDVVVDSYETIRPTLDGEMKQLCLRAVELYQRIHQVLRDRKTKGAEDDALSRDVTNLVLKVLNLGPKWNTVERGLGQTSADDLRRRLEELESKIRLSSDEIARQQYSLAKEALTGQLRYLQGIAQSRERMVARVHNYLATLERLQLALVNYGGADAAKLSDEVQPIADEINGLGQEMDFASDAMREVAEVASLSKERGKAVPVEKATSPAAGRTDNSSPPSQFDI